ncbi:MAG: LPXTG cell wall anchor domain-containing protein [Draconibacterium sp.]
MKKMKRLAATVAVFLMSLPFMLMAQEQTGTYIDNLNAQDSSYMQQDLGATAEQSSSGNTAVIIIVAVVVIAAIVFFVVKKKKK